MGCSFSAENNARVSPLASVTPIPENPAKDFHEKYLLGIKLGRGAFAQVRVVREAGLDSASQSKSAVKIIDLRDQEKPEKCDTSLIKVAKEEAAVWAAVGKHRHCVWMQEFFLGRYFCYMVMEKCKSSLLEALESMPELTERGLGNILGQMLLGIHHCHSCSVVHRDIKPDNFLVGGENGQTIKLADFGLSAILPKRGMLSGVFGTAPFMPPEMLRIGVHNEKADMWSFAVVAYVLVYGAFPYAPKQHGAKHMKQAIVEGNPPPSFEPAVRSRTHEKCASPSDTAAMFVKSLLKREPPLRPSAQDALSNPWMVAAMKGSHKLGEELPSLRSTLHAARKVGAFELRNTTADSPVDYILLQLQMERHGIPLPPTPKKRDPSEFIRKPSKEKTSGSKSRENLKVGKVPSNGNTLTPDSAGEDDSDMRSDAGSVFSGCSRMTDDSIFSGSIFSSWGKGSDKDDKSAAYRMQVGSSTS